MARLLEFMTSNIYFFLEYISSKLHLINLLFRLYEIQSGEIAMDGQNINSVNRDSLSKSIALIPQHPELFYRSLMDNIRYGDTAASDEAVYQAARSAEQLEMGFAGLPNRSPPYIMSSSSESFNPLGKSSFTTSS